ncbi:hypothetical protein [Pasteuria penetrans]|nr:hypothetical protein [Pasteuria penetrans]
MNRVGSTRSSEEALVIGVERRGVEWSAWTSQHTIRSKEMIVS